MKVRDRRKAQRRGKKKPRRGAGLLKRYAMTGPGYRTIGKQVGVSHVTVWAWAEARSIPRSIVHRRKLELATEGVVFEASWFDEDELRELAEMTPARSEVA